MEREIKCVAFDFNGVVGKFDLMQIYGKLNALDKMRALEVFVHLTGVLKQSKKFKELYKEYQCGKYSQNEYVSLISKYYPRIADTLQKGLNLLASNCKINYKMLQTISELRDAGYITALISNDMPETTNLIREILTPYMDYFAFSTEAGFRKPNKEIYDKTMQDLNLLPNQIIFIDDKEKNVNGANKLGIRAISYNGKIKDLNAEIESIIGEPIKIL